LLAEYGVCLFPEARSDINDVWIVDVFNFTPKIDTDEGAPPPEPGHDLLGNEPADFWRVDDIILFRPKEAQRYLWGRPDAVVDQDKELRGVTALERCEMDGAWRVAVPREDSDAILMTATMDESNDMERYTADQATFTNLTHAEVTD